MTSGFLPSILSPFEKTVTNQPTIERIQGVGLCKRVVSKWKRVCHRSLLHEGEQAATHVHLPPLHHPHLIIRKSSPKKLRFYGILCLPYIRQFYSE